MSKRSFSPQNKERFSLDQFALPSKKARAPYRALSLRQIEQLFAFKVSARQRRARWFALLCVCVAFSVGWCGGDISKRAPDYQEQQVKISLVGLFVLLPAYFAMNTLNKKDENNGLKP